MNEDVHQQRFPIRELVRRSGVNASTLRAWENRHGILKPMRTPSGHRLYDLNDVRRIRRLQEILAQGVGLAEAVPMLDAALLPTGTPPSEPGEMSEALPGGPAWRAYLRESLLALEDFSTERLDQVYHEACSLYPIDRVTDNLLLPALAELGLRWRQRPSGIAEEHFFTAWLRNKLGARMHHVAGVSRGRHLILACLPNETHELGLLVFALAALQRGYRVIYLGVNLPLAQLVHVARKTFPAGIVLSGRAFPGSEQSIAEIEALVRATPSPVFVGSHFSMHFRAALEQVGAIVLGDNIQVGLERIEAQLAARQATRARRTRASGDLPG